MKLRRAALLAFLVFAALGAIGATPASARTIWNLDLHHNETNFPPGGTAEYWVDLYNVGDTDSSGPVTLTIDLPPGITFESSRLDVGGGSYVNANWNCPIAPGSTAITCTTTTSIPKHRFSNSLMITVAIAPGAGPDVVTTAAVSGGGASGAPPIASCPPTTAACTSEPIHISSLPASFGIVDQSWVADFYKSDGVTPVRESGAHPDLATFAFDINSLANGLGGNGDAQKIPVENLRHVKVDLPPGAIGDPTAVGECTPAELSLSICPPSSQVGHIEVSLYPFSGAFSVYRPNATIYNMSHPRGAVSDLAFSVQGFPIHIRVSLNPANRYAISSSVLDINEFLPDFSSKVTLWGIPSDPIHDSERAGVGCGIGGCSVTPEKAFLTGPPQCDVDYKMRAHHYDSWQNSGVFGPDVDYTLPGHVTDCEHPRFVPEVEAVPTGKQANTPTGLDVHIKVGQNENPNALGTPPIKSAVVTLPEGMSFSPSFADGLQSCTQQQIGLFTNDPVKCPDASRIGEVALSTPLLPRRLEGSMYLAAQGNNPFQTTFALYMAIQDTEERGILVKIPGRIDVDPVTGQITTSFDDLPQFPVDDFTLKFRSGPRAPLVSPPSCGAHEIGIKIASYAQPSNPVDASNAYQISEGPNGTPCPPDAPRRPFHPSFSGGTLNPVAGSYSTFLFRLNRSDDEQELSQVTSSLPQGLVAKIAGVSLCPQAIIDSISQAEGTAVDELSHPACPAASQIGSISAGLGAGPGPNYFEGKVYLAGPYKGAPLSLAVVAPGIAGPFDLGSVVVRVALYVDPDTSKVKAVSDPFPTILHGVILRVRDVRLRIDRPDTTINPTSCAKKSVDGLISGTGGALFAAASPFQVAGCSDLSFKPKLDIRLFGGTRRGAHPKFKATATFPPGGANTAFAQVALPHSEFLDQGHIGTVCTRPQFAANACPAASIYGTVSAKTPLLDEELKGNIYLRSSSHQLPDIVAAFRGGRIDANLVGRVDSIHGGIRNTFEFVPDVPVTSATFTFFGGKKGLLVNSRNICKGKPKATALFKGQNGDELTLHPVLKSACKKTKKSKRRR